MSNTLTELKEISLENKALWNRVFNLYKSINELICGAKTDYNLSTTKTDERISEILRRAESSGEIRKKVLIAEADKLRAEQEQSGISPEVTEAYKNSMQELQDTLEEAKAAQTQIVEVYNRLKSEIDEIRKEAFSGLKDPALAQNSIKQLEESYNTFISEVVSL